LESLTGQAACKAGRELKEVAPRKISWPLMSPKMVESSSSIGYDEKMEKELVIWQYIN
jgi:hypothetical protein